MTTKRQWRAPVEADKSRKCRARNAHEKHAFYVEWNAEWNNWAIAGRPHILVSVHEVLDELTDKKCATVADFERGYFCAVSVLLREVGAAETCVQSLFAQGGDASKADVEDIELFREHGLMPGRATTTEAKE